MSGVGITGKIVPLNAGAFPVWEDINGQGGLRTVADITARNAVSANALFCKEGMLVYVKTTQCIYQLASDLVTWLFFAPSPALASQPAWAIDAATGSDNNSGIPGSPLATTEELNRRLCPGGAVWNMTVSVAVTIAAGSYGALALIYAAQEPLTGLTLSITGAFTSTNDTLTSVVNTTVGTQGRITLASGAALTARMRIRSTSGANIGAITYGVGPLNAVNDTFIKTWFPNTVSALASVNIVNGTTVGLDVITVTIARCNLQPVSHSSAQLATMVSDIICPNGLAILQIQGSSTATALSCKITGGLVNGNFRLVNCQFTGGPQFSFRAGGARGNPVLAGCMFSQTAALVAAITVSLNTSNCFDAATVKLSGAGTQFGGAGVASLQEWSNGAGLTAITLGTVSLTASPGEVFFWNTGTVIGFGTAYAIGFEMESGTSAVVDSLANCQIPSTTNVVMSGNARTYAQLPGYYGRANCFFSIVQDTTALFTNL